MMNPSTCEKTVTGGSLDKVDDRGISDYNGIAKFSTFELAEKYLIWQLVVL